MHFHIIAVGRLRRSVEGDLFEHFQGRIRWPLDIHEIDDRKSGTNHRKAREGKSILAAIPGGAIVAALDEKGRDLGSEDLATRIGNWQNSGISDVAFVIGGAEGLAEDVRRRADLVLAFGRATWPHLLMRGMLAEQLYRAQQILAGHPYHRA
jgi:23S rRNA (pseudouridine1915-N3)-methyltransferase